MLSNNQDGKGKGIHIDEKILNELRRIFEKFQVQKVLLFGSRARGDYKKTSDVDLAVFSENISDREFNLLVDEINEMDTALSFDVVHFENLKKEALKEKIIEDGILIYERKDN